MNFLKFVWYQKGNFVTIPYQNTTEILLGHQYSVIIKRILTYRCFLGQWAFSLANVMVSRFLRSHPKVFLSYCRIAWKYFETKILSNIHSAASRLFLEIQFLWKLVHGCFNDTRSHPVLKTEGLKMFGSWYH